MICSDCGREIANGSVSCQYCGKLFVSQRARAEEPQPKEQLMQLQSQLKSQETATDQAVSFRRKQRWVFYGVISLMFIGSVVMAVSIYNDYTKLAASYASLDLKFKSKAKEADDVSKELQSAQLVLNDSNATNAQLRGELQKIKNSLKDMTDRNTKIDNDLTSLKQSSEVCSLALSSHEAMSYNLVARLGQKLSPQDLAKVPLAVVEAEMLDTDKDGLVDEFETVIGTSDIKPDTDGDGYDDKSEIERAFNPTGEGRWADKVIEAYKGKILLSQNIGVTTVWYVAQNGKRYYLGQLENNLKFMTQSKYWNTKEAL